MKKKIDKKGIFVCGYGCNGRLGLGDSNNRNIPTKLEMKNIKIVHNSGFKRKWSPNEHKFFPKHFRDSVFSFLLSLNRLSKQKSNKKSFFLLPKPILSLVLNFTL